MFCQVHKVDKWLMFGVDGVLWATAAKEEEGKRGDAADR